jgi:predicted acetyltransferase
MYLIATCLKVEDLRKIYTDKNTKFFDVQEIMEEFKENNKLIDIKYFDLHFNSHLQLKLQNCLKSIKTTQLIYVLDKCDPQTLHNIKKFIMLKKENKFKGFIYLTKKCNKTLINKLTDIGYVVQYL